MTDARITFRFAKLDDEKRIVTGWAAIASDADGKPIVDHQGDVLDIGNLEDAFIEAFADGGMAKGGEMHKRVGGADVVGHMVLSRDERIALGFGPGPEGAIVKLRINDDEQWAKVKRGDYREFSMAGECERIEI